jgi:hypothetical protein
MNLVMVTSQQAERRLCSWRSNQVWTSNKLCQGISISDLPFQTLPQRNLQVLLRIADGFAFLKIDQSQIASTPIERYSGSWLYASDLQATGSQCQEGYNGGNPISDIAGAPGSHVCHTKAPGMNLNADFRHDTDSQPLGRLHK